MPSLLDQLAGGDLRTLGRSADVAAQVLARPERIDELFAGLAGDDAVIRARAADALEKVSARRPELLQPYKRELLTRVAASDHWVVREHVCQMLPRLEPLTPAERRTAVATVRGYLADRSSIVKTCALECLVRLSAPPAPAALRRDALAIVKAAAVRGTPAMRARARLLLKRIARPGPGRGRA